MFSGKLSQFADLVLVWWLFSTFEFAPVPCWKSAVSPMSPFHRVSRIWCTTWPRFLCRVQRMFGSVWDSTLWPCLINPGPLAAGLRTTRRTRDCQSLRRCVVACCRRNPRAIIVDGTGEVTERKLGYHQPGTLLLGMRPCCAMSFCRDCGWCQQILVPTLLRSLNLIAVTLRWHIISHPFKSKPVGYFLIFACRFHHLIQSELSLENFRLVRQGLWLIETQMVETAGWSLQSRWWSPRWVSCRGKRCKIKHV